MLSGPSRFAVAQEHKIGCAHKAGPTFVQLLPPGMAHESTRNLGTDPTMSACLRDMLLIFVCQRCSRAAFRHAELCLGWCAGEAAVGAAAGGAGLRPRTRMSVR